MSPVFSRLIAVVASFFIFSAAWFCLWSISLHLVERPELAVLLFPFGLRLGLMLQCPRGYWPVSLGAEWLMLIWLAQEVALAHLPLLMTGSLLTLIPVALISRYRHQRDWRTLLRQGAALIAAALLQSLPWVGEKEVLNALLLTLTGGLTLAPTCLVFWHYLTSTVWQPLGPALVSQPVNWRARHLIWYLLLFVVSLWLQLGLPAELSRFTPFCLALPIIALAWHYGWQGALIATLMNAIALIASQTTGLAKWAPALSNLAPAFTAMNFAAVSCMTIPIILLIAMNLAKAKKMPPFITGVLAVICYFAMVPNTITVTIQEATGKASGLSGGVLGAQGLFVGMLVAVLITNLFHWLTSIEKIKIKMPASVPAGIANSFNILIPVFVIIVFSSVFGTLFQLATGSYINEFIYAVVQAPLSAAVQSIHIGQQP